MVFHPISDAAEDALGDVLCEEGHASGLTYGVGEKASDGRAEGGDGYEEEEVGVGGGEEDQEDVGDAGEGERDEGAVDCGDGEQADEAEVAEEVDEAVVGWGRGGLEDEERGRGGERGAHAGYMTLAGRAGMRGISFYADKLEIYA